MTHMHNHAHSHITLTMRWVEHTHMHAVASEHEHEWEYKVPGHTPHAHTVAVTAESNPDVWAMLCPQEAAR
jgi:hypothetical protein